MTPAPSSPVPAVEAERPTWWPEIVETVARRLCSDAGDDPDGLSNVTVEHRDGHTTSGTFSRTWKLWVEQADALLSTPTPGRAAEPDTMVEVERCISTAISEAQIAGQFGEGAFAQHWADKALSAVRTIATERDAARTRAETAEAQLATLRAEVEKLRETRAAQREALERIHRWQGEFPPTGEFWDDRKTQPMSYGAAYGSNGERDFMREVARKALVFGADR
jgi:hypothetical protein